MRRGVPAGLPSRAAQAQRSTFLGAMGGRLANASPVPLNLPAARTALAISADPPAGGLAGPVVWYVAADAGAPGATVSTMPARNGPNMVYPTWESGPHAVISGDAPPAFRFANLAPLTTYNDETSADLGLAHGVTGFIVASLPPDAVDYDHAAIVDWGFNGDPIGDVDFGNWAVTIRTSGGGQVLVETIYATATYGPVSGPLITGGMQLFEIRSTAGVGTHAVRVAGNDLVLTGGATGALADFRLRMPNLPACGNAHGPAKVWEAAAFRTELTGAALAAARRYFGDRYGIPT